MWSRADDIAYHQRAYARGRNSEPPKLRRNGFEVLFSASYTAVLLPLDDRKSPAGEKQPKQ